jgi:hypothetical protein
MLIRAALGNTVGMDAPERAHRLLAATEAWFPFPIDPAAVNSGELALAGFVRCRRLLQGMAVVHDAPDLAGLFARAIYETYLGALFLLLGEDIARGPLEADEVYDVSRIAMRFLDSSEGDDSAQATAADQSDRARSEPLPREKRIDIADLGEEARKLLLEAHDPHADLPLQMYETLFGPESYTSAHGGLAAIKQYMLENGQPVPRISADPWHRGGDDHRLDLMTAALLALGHKIGTTVGLPLDDLDELARQWDQEVGST